MANRIERDGFLDRFQDRIAELGISERAACLKAGLSVGVVKNLRDRNHQLPSMKTVGALAPALGVTPEWLAFGSGARLADPAALAADTIEGPTRDRQHARSVSSGRLYKGSRVGAIPEVEDRAGAGDGQIGEIVAVHSGGIESGHRVVGEWILPIDTARHWIGVDPRRSLLMSVKGDSMEPTLRSNDRVIVDLTDTNPYEPAVYVIDEGHGPLVKRVRILAGTDPLRLHIQSDNPLGGSWERPAELVRIIGRVRGKISVL